MTETDDTALYQPIYVVDGVGTLPELVAARNWMTALAEALESNNLLDCLGRLAIERLPNGTVIAQDLDARRRFVVRIIG